MRSGTPPCPRLRAKRRRRCLRRSAADVRELALRGVLGDPPALEAGLVGPVVGVLRLPRPLDPACSLLVRDSLRTPGISIAEEADEEAWKAHLCLPVLAEEGLVARAER